MAQQTKEDTESSSTTPPLIRRTAADCSIPSQVFYFPTRGDSFRSESFGLLGAKRILLERGNMEGNEEPHFLCDNKSNIDLLQQMQKDEEFVPRRWLFRDHVKL